MATRNRIHAHELKASADREQLIVIDHGESYHDGVKATWLAADVHDCITVARWDGFQWWITLTEVGGSTRDVERFYAVDADDVVSTLVKVADRELFNREARERLDRWHAVRRVIRNRRYGFPL